MDNGGSGLGKTCLLIGFCVFCMPFCCFFCIPTAAACSAALVTGKKLPSVVVRWGPKPDRFDEPT